ncbi:MAG: response regulator [Rhodopila sp.]|nr:response regulator [Rhodopila sp.]
MTDNPKNVVAIVDDDPAVRDSLQFLLEAAGYSAVTYGSAAAFLDGDADWPACLIVDQHMPEMTGLELAAQLRRDGANIPVLLVTASPSTFIVARAVLLGIEMVAEKPVGEDDLLKFVKDHR